jgi:hypothetical protein
MRITDQEITHRILIESRFEYDGIKNKNKHSTDSDLDQ